MRSKLAFWLPNTTQLVALLAGLLPATVLGQVASMPVALQLTSSAREIRMGQSVTLTVTLKSSSGATAPARAPTIVTVTTPLLPQPVTLRLATGVTSAAQQVRFPSPGVAPLRATSPNMTPGSALVVVTRPTSSNRLHHRNPLNVPTAGALELASQSSAGLGGPVTHTEIRARAYLARLSRPRMGAVLLAAVPPGPPPARIRLDVQPPSVHPHQKSWKASIHLTNVNEAGEPVVTHEDIQVQLSASLGRPSPEHVTIPAGSSTNPTEISLTATAPGQDTVQAWTPRGSVEQRVEYEAAVPTRLRITTPPDPVQNSGKSLVRITVLLLDDQGDPTSFTDRDVQVMLSTTRGELQPPNPVKIPRGMIGADATLTSPTSGAATISGFLQGVHTDPGSVLFVFPWLLVLLAVAGGVLGAVTRDTTTTGFRLRRLAFNLIPGVILGLVFYALTLFGAIGSIPKTMLPINTTVIPTFNELGALLLGILGGYVGARFLQPAAALRPGGAGEQQAKEGLGRRRRI